MTTKQLLIVSPNTVIRINESIEGDNLKAAIRENFGDVHGYIELVGDMLKVWEAGKAVAAVEGLNDSQYIRCFYDWVDAVENCGVEIEATIEFHELLDEAIKWCDL
ncbi:hypothetical protein VP393E501_P0052 [Vibrio phage 393E50-1]|nr:hypothetical protein VP393E501_P0052 [Vibrio phage 393E50-1]